MHSSVRFAARLAAFALFLAPISSVAYASSYTASAVPFNFVEASGGTLLGLNGADDQAVAVALPFAFTFYNTTYNSLFVSSNGLITFGAANTAFTNQDLTSGPNEAAIAPFWDDLFITGQPAANVYAATFGAPGSQQFVIQWNQISFFSGGTAGDGLTFEVILFEGSNNIRFNYRDLISGSAAGNNGGSATVGIKDAGVQGADRLLLAFNNGPNAFVGSEHSTLITREAVPEPTTITLVGMGVLAAARRRFVRPRK